MALAHQTTKRSAMVFFPLSARWCPCAWANVRENCIVPMPPSFMISRAASWRSRRVFYKSYCKHAHHCHFKVLLQYCPIIHYNSIQMYTVNIPVYHIIPMADHEVCLAATVDPLFSSCDCCASPGSREGVPHA